MLFVSVAEPERLGGEDGAEPGAQFRGALALSGGESFERPARFDSRQQALDLTPRFADVA